MKEGGIKPPPKTEREYYEIHIIHKKDRTQTDCLRSRSEQSVPDPPQAQSIPSLFLTPQIVHLEKNTPYFTG